MSGAVRPLQLGKYRLIAKLGQGGAASVYLAVASGPGGVNKLLVVKVLKRDLAAEPENVRMFLDEARLCTRLSHPNIVQMIEVGKEGDFYFTVMEYLDGQPFSRLMNGIPGIGADVLLHLLADSLGGLHSAHELAAYDGTLLGVVHRDISPNNLFVTYDGHAKVLDFGVAKTMESAETEYGVVKGKPRYMAPEQALGYTLDRRADVFSAGVILWEIVAGRRLWAGKNDMGVLFAVCNGQIPRLLDVAPNAPPELVRIIGRALAPEKEDRYPTALALQEDLEAYLQTKGEAVTTRHVGRTLASHFAAARAEMKATVDAQLRALATLSSDFEVVTLPPGFDPGLFGTADVSTSRGDGAHSTRPPFALSNSTPAPPRSSHGWLFAAGAVVLAVVGVLGWSQVPSMRAASPAGSAVASIPPSPDLPASPLGAIAPVASPTPTTIVASPVASSAGSIELTLRVSPADALLFLDGRPLDANPFIGRLPKDDRPHVLRAIAPGFVTREEPLALTRDVTIELALARRAHGVLPKAVAPAPDRSAAPIAAGAPSPSPPSASPPSGAPPAPAATSSTKKRAVDRTDPYAQ
jgi:serine/threonine-protein kinase